jgi:SulP family sulfate permease
MPQPYLQRLQAWFGAPNQILANLFAGLITGLVSVIYSVSYAVLIFSGPLADFFPVGISVALLSATLLALIVGFNSSFQFAVGGPDSDIVAILGLITGVIAAELAAAGAMAALLPTVITVLGASALTAGLFLVVAGKLHVGRWVRFAPYPVIGGILASSGWLFVRGSFKVMTGLPLEVGGLATLGQPEVALRWLPGLLFALATLFLTRRYTHYLLTPGLFIGAVGLFYLLFWSSGLTLPAAIEQGWLFEPFARSQFWWSRPELVLAQVDWVAIAGQSGSLLAVTSLFVMISLLSASAIELATETDADLDRELSGAGWANIVTGLAGGLIGGVSPSRTLLNYRAGGRSRLSGVVVSLFCALILFIGTPWLGYIPKPILGGFLLYLGLSLLWRWLYQTWFQLSLGDYLLIWAMPLTVATIGFLEGVGVGLVIACLIFTVSYSRAGVIKHELSGAAYWSNRIRPHRQEQTLQAYGRQIHILWLQGYLFFGTAAALVDHIRRQLEQESEPAIRFLVLDFQLVNGLDISALHSFSRLQRLARGREITLVYTDLSDHIRRQFEREKLLNEASDNQIFPDLDRGVEWCEEQVLAARGLRRQRFLPLALQLEDLFLAGTDQVRRFMAYLELERFQANQTLIREGDQTEALYFVEDGQVSVLSQLDHGQTRRISTMGAGAILGELGVYRQAVASASVVTDRPSRIYRLPKAALARMEEQDPDLAVIFHRFIASLVAERLVSAMRTIDLLLR